MQLIFWTRFIYAIFFTFFSNSFCFPKSTCYRDIFESSQIDKLIFADPPLCVTQTKKRPFFRKKCLRSCFVDGQFNFVTSNKQRPAKRMYLANSGFNLAFSVPFHANCHEKLGQLKYLRTSSLSRRIYYRVENASFHQNVIWILMRHGLS